MIHRRTKFRSDQRGTAGIEMAIALPVLVTAILGIFTVGQLFEANAGMQHALGEGARYGTLCLAQGTSGCTLPTGTAIKAQVNSKLFGTSNGTFTTADPSTPVVRNKFPGLRSRWMTPIACASATASQT